MIGYFLDINIFIMLFILFDTILYMYSEIKLKSYYKEMLLANRAIQNRTSEALRKLQFCHNQELNSNKPRSNQALVNAQRYQEELMEIVNKRKEILNPMMSISYYPHPLKINHAKGVFFYEENGKQTLDCINNVSHIGHCNDYYISKMRQQMGKLVTNSRFLYDQLLQTTQKLLEKFPPELCVVTFVNSGSQANDLALQMAEIHTRKRGIICLDGAYHGVTKACMDISPYKWNQNYVKPMHVKIANSPSTFRGFLRDVENPIQVYKQHIESIIDQNTGAFICQFMQSCGGQIIPPKGLYKQVYAALRNKGVVCIGDQVQTGFGRMGSHFWAFQYYDVIPDIVTVGKAMGNGFPVSAVICTKQISESFKNNNIEFFSTFGGNPLASVAAGAVLDVIKNQKLQENAQKTGEYIMKKLEAYKQKYDFVGDIRGSGLFIGIDIVKDKQSREQDPQMAKKIIIDLRKRGALVSRDGPKANILKIKPPIIFNQKNAQTLLGLLTETLQSIIKQA